MSGKGAGGRSRGAVLGAALGASIGIPAGLLQDYLVTMLPPDHQRQRQLRLQQTEDIIAGQGKKERKTILSKTSIPFIYLANFCCNSFKIFVLNMYELMGIFCCSFIALQCL